MNPKGFVRRHPVAAYFGVAYALSIVAAMAIYGPHLMSGAPMQAMTSLLMFPMIVIGVGLAGIALTTLARTHKDR